MKMKVLVVLTLAVVAPALASGRLVSKCELRSLLEDAGLQLSEGARRRLSDEDFVAKIVCHVEKSTGFNTSAVSQVSPDREAGGPPRRGERVTAGGRLSVAHLDPTKPPSRVPDRVWTLYGLFQLSDHLVCSSGSIPSLNLCEMDCMDFVDEDVDDDIACLELLKMKLENGLHGPHKMAFMRMAKLLFQRECYGVVASTYFSDC